MNIKAIRKKIWLPRNDWDAPSKGLLCEWVREGDETSHERAPLIDMVKYRELLSVLPDHIVENLEKARLSRAGLYPMLRAGLGAEDMLSAIIIDATAIASSAAEAKLAPSITIQGNYMQPGGLPGKTLRWQLRGRGTTLTTGATMTVRNRIAATDVITGNIVSASGAIAADATAQTNTMWSVTGELAVRTVGSAGTVFAMGEANLAWGSVFTAANNALRFMSSAGSSAPAAQTWDMGVLQYFQWTGQWSLATAYSIQCHNYILEALN